MFKTTYFFLSVFEDPLERKTHFHINETTSTFPLNSQEDQPSSEHIFYIIEQTSKVCFYKKTSSKRKYSIG